MNREHAQQDKGHYQASCWDCVNNMRLECIEFLALVAGGHWEKAGASMGLDAWGREYPVEIEALDVRVRAATAYLANTTFTDEEEGMQQ